MPNFEAVRFKYGRQLDEPSVESLLAHLVLGKTAEWELPCHQSTHDTYFNRRDRKNAIRVARVLEAGLSLTLTERQMNWIERAH
jgi:hypothetical protein